ncbi:MAG: alpha/beta hydrolase [Myxococcota bacterium]
MIGWWVGIASAAVVQTAQGPVDTTMTGEGPAVLVFHGSPGGSDQGRLLQPLADSGFTVIAMSRPGYLGTPLQAGATFEEQADLAASLLDALEIDDAAALGMSAGGPVALAFGTRHPERTWAVVLEAGVVDAYVPSDLAKNKLLGKLVLSRTFGGVTFRSLRRSMLRKPERSARRLLAIESTLDEPAREDCATAIAAEPEPWSILADSFVPYRDRRRGLRNDLAELAAVDASRWRTLSAPTLLQYSPSDADVPVAHAEALLEQGVDAELVLHEDACGHFLWFGPSAEAVAATRLRFLRAQQGSLP